MSEVSPKVWFEGRIVDSAAVQVPVLTHSLHYGLGAFEGLRAYRLADGRSAIFRLQDHIDRLNETCNRLTLGNILKWPRAAMVQACVEVLRANGLPEAYIRPLVFVGQGLMGLGAMTNPVHTVISAWRWGAYLGDYGLEHGVRACYASQRRHYHQSLQPCGKVTGLYVVNILAKREAIVSGFDEALLLDGDDHVVGSSGSNLFMVQGGELLTPMDGPGVISGITRETVVRIAKDLGIPVRHAELTAADLSAADEVFLAGTATEITPVRAIGGKDVGHGTRGPMTATLQAAYFEVVTGMRPEYAEWLTPFEVTES